MNEAGEVRASVMMTKFIEVYGRQGVDPGKMLIMSYADMKEFCASRSNCIDCPYLPNLVCDILEPIDVIMLVAEHFRQSENQK